MQTLLQSHSKKTKEIRMCVSYFAPRYWQPTCPRPLNIQEYSIPSQTCKNTRKHLDRDHIYMEFKPDHDQPQDWFAKVVVETHGFRIYLHSRDVFGPLERSIWAADFKSKFLFANGLENMSSFHSWLRSEYEVTPPPISAPTWNSGILYDTEEIPRPHWKAV